MADHTIKITCEQGHDVCIFAGVGEELIASNFSEYSEKQTPLLSTDRMTSIHDPLNPAKCWCGSPYAGYTEKSIYTIFQLHTQNGWKSGDEFKKG